MAVLQVDETDAVRENFKFNRTCDFIVVLIAIQDR